MKRTYYKAELVEMTELFVNNNPEEGCDPDTCRDCGVTQVITKPTLEELRKMLPEDVEQFEDENRYEYGYEYMERDGTHVSVMQSYYITKVVEEIEDVTFNEAA